MAAQGYTPASQAWQGSVLTVVYQLTTGRNANPNNAMTRWETEEFRIPLDGREYESAGIRFDGGLTWSDAVEPINQAVLAFVRKAGEQGWEPMEPTDAERLFRAQRIEGAVREKSTLMGLGSPNYVWRPSEVRIKFRRQVVK
jgi:hypothetical protein